MQTIPRRFLLATIPAAAGRTERASAAEHGALSDLSSTGGSRLGSVFPRPSTPARRRPRGAAPLQTVIEKATVDAQIDRLDTIDGVTQNSTGPLAVPWNDDLGAVGRRGNAAMSMSGHVDCRDVGPAVFRNLNRLVTGDGISVVIDGPGDVASALALTTNHVVAAMTPADFDETIGGAGEEALSPIACNNGTLDETPREYRVRAELGAVATA